MAHNPQEPHYNRFDWTSHNVTGELGRRTMLVATLPIVLTIKGQINEFPKRVPT